MKRFKEHQLEYMEKHQQHIDAKDKEQAYENRYYHDGCYKLSPWRYIPKLLKKNIGKDVDEVTSKVFAKFKEVRMDLPWFDILEHVATLFTNHRNADHHDRLMNFSTQYGYGYRFRHFPEFSVDSQNRIQLNKNYPKPERHVYRVLDFSKEIEFLRDISPMYSRERRWVKVDPRKDKYLFGQLYEEFLKNPQRDSIWLSHLGYGYSHNLFKVNRNSVTRVVSRYEFIRDRYERFQKEHLRRVASKKHSRSIVYDMLSRAERELKKEKEFDQIRLYKHGFDDESFKGGPYHGQKRKLKDVS